MHWHIPVSSRIRYSVASQAQSEYDLSIAAFGRFIFFWNSGTTKEGLSLPFSSVHYHTLQEELEALATIELTYYDFCHSPKRLLSKIIQSPTIYLHSEFSEKDK